MAKKKYEFKPDKLASGVLNKLYMTKKQRMSVLRWVLFSLVLLVTSLLQDVILSHMDIFGATTDLVPCTIIMISVLLGSDRCCIFALISSIMYQFSGSGPGYHAVAIITLFCIFGAMFRQIYLHRGFFSCLLCSAVLVMVYEMIIFFVALFLGQTMFSRILVPVFTGVLTILTLPLYYFIANAIDKIGGDQWND